jgi:hypothetical protein
MELSCQAGQFHFFNEFLLVTSRLSPRGVEVALFLDIPLLLGVLLGKISGEGTPGTNFA